MVLTGPNLSITGRNFGGAPGLYSQEMVSISTFVDVYINKTKNKYVCLISTHPVLRLSQKKR
jgi:hypothetical protein